MRPAHEERHRADDYIPATTRDGRNNTSDPSSHILGIGMGTGFGLFLLLLRKSGSVTLVGAKRLGGKRKPPCANVRANIRIEIMPRVASVIDYRGRHILTFTKSKLPKWCPLLSCRSRCL